MASVKSDSSRMSKWAYGRFVDGAGAVTRSPKVSRHSEQLLGNCAREIPIEILIRSVPITTWFQ
jgi:hypothetical protein